jgi:hypothetical protein
MHLRVRLILSSPSDPTAGLPPSAFGGGFSQVWTKLQREAPIGALVIEFAAADYYSGLVPFSDMQVCALVGVPVILVLLILLGKPIAHDAGT